MKCCASPCDILQSYYTHVKSKVFIYLYAYTYEYKLCSFFFKNKLSKVLLLSNILFCVSCIHFSSLGESWFFMWFIFHVLKKGLNICDYFNVTYSILRNFSRLFLWNNIHPSVNSLRAKITGTGERDCKPSSYKKIGNKKKHF